MIQNENWKYSNLQVIYTLLFKESKTVILNIKTLCIKVQLIKGKLVCWFTLMSINENTSIGKSDCYILDNQKSGITGNSKPSTNKA
jgi:hypothetical protein